MDQQIINDAAKKLEAALEHLRQEFIKIQTGRASPALVENLMVDSYGSMMPLKGLASISIPEPKQIMIQPWDRSILGAIEKAIRNSTLGLNPMSDGVVVRLNLPPLTEERRKELVKVVHHTAEESRIAVRNVRHEALDHLKRLEKEKALSEDALKVREKELQKKIDDTNAKVEEIAKAKEAEVMKV